MLKIGEQEGRVVDRGHDAGGRGAALLLLLLVGVSTPGPVEAGHSGHGERGLHHCLHGTLPIPLRHQPIGVRHTSR